MAYVKRTYTGPGVKVVVKYHTYRFGGCTKRGPNEKTTTRQQEKINSRNSINAQAELMDTNFQEGDMRIDLTYAGEEPSPEEAKKDIDNFLSRVRRFYKKQGEEFRWMLVTEYKAESSRKGKGQRVRIHHHLMCNYVKGKVDFGDIKKLWPHCKLRYNSMRRFDGGYEASLALVKYLTKETDWAIKEKDAIQKVRIRHSRNLMKPDVKKEIIYSRKWADKPKPSKGYVITDTYNGFTSEGYPMQRVVMVKDLTDKDTAKWKAKIERILRRKKGGRKRKRELQGSHKKRKRN